MLKLGKTKRTVAVTATALALAGGLGTASATANAAERPANCSVIDIGDPGQMWVQGEYVGEVEQQYDSCAHVVIAHWQWAGGWQQNHGGTSRVAVYLQATNFYQGPINDQPDSVKDVTAYVDVHATSPDQWEAQAVVQYAPPVGLYCAAHGTVHDYSNGGTISGAVSDWC